MKIYINNTGNASTLFIFPMLPEEIGVETAVRFQSYDIMNLGEVKIPAGEELTRFSWSGILPGERRKNEPFVSNWTDPKEIQSLISIWRSKRQKLHLMITETTINHDVYLEKFDPKYKGGHGDIEYTISFVVAKDLIVRVEGEPEQAAVYSGAAYIVKPGDSIWTVAEITLGDGGRYEEIYHKNKDLIDTANIPMILDGAPGVDYLTIHAGQVLLVP